MSRNFDREIKLLGEKKHQLLEKLEKIKQEFVSNFADFLREWYEKETVSLVETKSELTKQLGAESLGNLKRQVRVLQNNAPEIASRHLDDAQIWWHIEKRGELRPFLDDIRRVPEKINTAMCFAAGELGSLLEEYHYVSTNPNHTNSWRQRAENFGSRIVDTRPYYPFGIQVSIEMENLLKSYNNTLYEYRRALEELERVEAEKLRGEARSLWENA